MTVETRLAIVDHGVRWANNIVAELLNSHGAILSQKKRDSLREIVIKLGNFLGPE
jgi:hypothetical protein